MRLRSYASTLLATVLVTLSAASSASSEEAGSAPPSAPQSAAARQDKTVRLALQPAAEPEAALRYQLLPGIMERRTGSAALEYAKVAASWNDRSKDLEEVWELVQLPLEKLSRERARAALAPHRARLRDLKSAARYATYDWQLPPRGETSVFTLVADDVQPIRHCAWLLALEARLAIVDGRFDDALEALKAGYAMARHVGGGPLLIQSLVGLAVSDVMSRRVEEWIARPGSPNLYWALTALPRPLIDMRLAMDFEMHWPHWSYSGPGRLEEDPAAAKHWARLLVDMGGTWPGEDEAVQRSYTAWVMRLYPTAKRMLVQRGRSREKVEAMPVEQAVGLWMMEPYLQERDRLCKWAYLPYWQAREGLKQAVADFERQREKVDAHTAPLLSTLGALQAPMFARDRNERTIAALRTLEAIRMYGANHDGRLPERLSDCDVPIPINALTGRALDYHKRGDTAVLEAPSEDPDRGDAGIRYEIRFAR